jgi:putative transposase
MARAVRILLPDYPHHVIHRGHNRSPLYSCETDFNVYLANLAELKIECGCLVHAFCLMTNHVHLIVTPVDNAGNLSKLMKKVAGRYTGYMNATYSRTGTAWNGRFKSNPIQTNQYLLACSRYVELNPVRAGMVSRPDDYRWSSFHDRTGVHRLSWLDEDPVYRELGSNRQQREASYRQFFWDDKANLDHGPIRRAIQGGFPLGDDSFLRYAEDRLGIRISNRRPGRPKRLNK